MSNYRRLISYIYAYEGGVKGKNIGFAKIEIRNGQCRIHVNVKRIFLGNSDIGVYLLSPQMEILLGRIFIRNGAGEFRANVNAINVENSGCSMEQCYGLTIHDMENAWRSYTTIWEDAVTQAAEVELANVTAERAGIQAGERADSSVSEEIQRELEQEDAWKGQAELLADSEMIHIPGPKEEGDKTDESPADDQPDRERTVQEEVGALLSGDYENVGGKKNKTRENNLNVGEDDKKQGINLKEVEKLEETGGGDRADGKAGTETRADNPENAGGGGRIDNMGSAERGEQTDAIERAEGWDKADDRAEVGSGAQTEAGKSLEKSGPHLETVNPETEFPQADIGEDGWIRGTPMEPVWRGGAPSPENQAGSLGGGVQEKMMRLAKVFLQGRTQAEKGAAPLPSQTESAVNIPSAVTGAAAPPRPVTMTKVPVSTLPEPEDPARLAELDRQERAESARGSIWNQLQRRYAKVLAFDYENGCEILSIKPQDIGILPRENWIYGNNSFLLHGYYNYRHLILARLENPNGQPRYLLGVPGHYFSNEKNLASMFGFPHFVLAKKQPEQDGRFGYWYTDLRL